MEAMQDEAKPEPEVEARPGSSEGALELSNTRGSGAYMCAKLKLRTLSRQECLSS